MRRLVLAAVAALAASPACADCSHFKWSVTQDVTALANPKMLPPSTGTADLGDGYTMLLSQDVKLPVAPERPPAKGSYAGFFNLPKLEGGVYQVTLSGEAWIDVAQNGALVKSSDFSGQRDCAEARKSVRFPLAAGAATVQISNATSGNISFVVSKAE